MKNKTKTSKVLSFRVLIEQDEDGVFVASVPTLPGCHTEGDTYEEAIGNIKDVIALFMDIEKDKLEPDDTHTEFVGVKNITVSYGISSHTYTSKAS